MSEYTLTLDKDLIGPWICHRINKVWGPEGRECMGVLNSEGKLVAAGMFEDYTGVCITGHIACEGSGIALRTLLGAAYHYVFVTLDCEKFLGLVNSNNRKALTLDLKMGFRPEAVIEGVFPGGDLVVLVMNRDECRWIAPEHRKVA